MPQIKSTLNSFRCCFQLKATAGGESSLQEGPARKKRKEAPITGSTGSDSEEIAGDVNIPHIMSKPTFYHCFVTRGKAIEATDEDKELAEWTTFYHCQFPKKEFYTLKRNQELLHLLVKLDRR